MALAHAEMIDHFVQQCNECQVNRLARAKCSYTAWNDQSLATKAKQFLDRREIKTGNLPVFCPASQSLQRAFEMPVGLDENISVLIVNPSAEGGMPHTRAPSLICLPAYFPEERLESTIKHELVHISQRRNPSLWRTRAAQEGWVPVDESEIPQHWLARCRLNPDTAAARFFAWQGRHVPLPVFIREDKPDLRDIQVRWYDRTEGIVKSGVPTSFTQKYGHLGISSLEHPYELWAYHA